MKRLRKAALRLAIAGVLGALLLVAIHLLLPFPAAEIGEAGRGGSALILDREGGLIAWRVDSREEWRLPVAVENVTPWLVKATVAAEDKRFFSHVGVDPAALIRALEQNISGGRRVSGASTLTMQAVRLLHPRGRTYANKAAEAFRAVQLERLAGKDEILELYFNLAPYGGNVVGAEAAARIYFGKAAADLSLGEAALLAGIPQRPARFNPRKDLAAALARRWFVLDRMRELGFAGTDDVEAATREPIVLAQRPVPSDAARFADWIIARQGRDCGEVRTTLDPRTQAAVGATVREHAARLSALGIDGLAAVVIDVERSEIISMVGSSDPADPLSGQVNAAAALRQPGSLLKPFIYARAYDGGVLTPDSVVYDVPTSWRGYTPENIDREFLGPIPAHRALSESRNLPAVRLLDRLSTETLAADMAALGVPFDAAVDRYGLSLALGTAEVRLVDAAGAFAALARLGEWKPLRAVAGSPDAPGTRVYSPGAAYLTLRSLGDPACKTGTSWNHRDAWAAVVTPSRVVAVWCGKLSGEGHPELVGARTALPVALELLDRLSCAGSWTPPDSIRSRDICAASGAPAGTCCPRVTQGEYIPGVCGDAPCSLHRRAGAGVIEAWPPEIAAWLASRSETASQAPPTLSITHPRSGAEYVLTEAGLSSNVMQLEAQAAPGAEWVYWFMDGELLRRAAPRDAVPWTIQPGRHEVLASDGRCSSVPVVFSVTKIGR